MHGETIKLVTEVSVMYMNVSFQTIQHSPVSSIKQYIITFAVFCALYEA